jgi:hypothetical protein
MYQIDLSRFVDPPKLCRSPALRQTLPWRIAVRKLDGRFVGALPELSLIKKPCVRILLDVMNKPDDCKGSPNIDFNHGLFEVVMHLEKERCDWLLLVQGFEISRTLFQGAKQDDIKHLEDASRVRGQHNVLHPDTGENRDKVIRRMRGRIIH